MDFLNKSLAQLSELFRSMTPGARITAGLLLAVVIVSLGYLFRQSTAGPDAFLFGGQALSDGELNRIEAALGRANITWVRENNRIRVPFGQQTTALGAIADADALPMNFNTILEDSLGKGGPWESSAAQRERQKIAKQGALTDMIRAMPWVEEAMVLYDEQSPQGLSRTKQLTGSVSVRPMLGETLDARRTKVLQKLVASSLVGMKPEDVTVTDLGDGGASGSSGGAIDLLDDEYYQTKIAFEMQRKEAILSVLRDIPGVRVEVNAELDDTLEETTTNMKPDKTSIAAARTVEVTENSSQTTTKGGGQPGPVAQGPTRQGATESPQQNANTVKNEETQTDNVVGVEQSKVVRKGFTPKAIIATVMIPTSYLHSIWKVRNPDATDPPKPEDLVQLEDPTRTKIENLVEPYVMLQANRLEDTFKYVKVEFLDSLPLPTIEPPSTASQALAWASRYWGTVAMLGVAMFSLLIMRSVVKNGATSEPPGAGAAAPALTLHSEETPTHGAGETSEEESENDRPRLRLKKGKSLKDDLVEIVHEDPDAAAEILRSWIGKVA
jgi:flagellar M-ring protein FliF